MNLKTRLAKLEARRALAGGGVAVLLQSGQVSYRGKVFASVADLPSGGYLLALEAMPTDEWSARAQAYFHEHPDNGPWVE